ncbi:MAG: DUF21 domain-containing protein, partial [Nevskia sp.]|nr:DUF21 domain-containing protein [Nevskia sp.]
MEGSVPLAGATPWSNLLLMGLCLLVVAFFSSSEAALLSVSKIRIRHLAEQGHRGARAVARLVKQHDKLFATILTTENAMIILASSLGTVLLLKIFGEQYLVLGSLIMTVFIVIFGEITPKTFAAQNAERISLLVARPMEAIIKALWWAILPFTTA